MQIRLAAQEWTRILPFLWLFLVSAAALQCLSAPATAQQAADPGAVKAHVREILSQREFRIESADDPLAKFGRAVRERWNRVTKWFQDRWATLQNWLKRLFSGFGGTPVAASFAASIMAKVFVVLFIGLGGWLIAWMIRRFWIEREQRSAKARTAYIESEDDEGIVLEPDAWLQQAGAYAAGDDYRRAFRAVFVAILLRLDRAGLIEFDRSRTNGDYLRLLRRSNVRRIYEIVDPLVLEFDRRWYGRAETRREDYERIQQAFERIVSLLTEPDSAAGAAHALGKA